jgi:predicted DCC family thiol-disulfide oxidoreductase YuxK
VNATDRPDPDGSDRPDDGDGAADRHLDLDVDLDVDLDPSPGFVLPPDLQPPPDFDLMSDFDPPPGCEPISDLDLEPCPGPRSAPEAGPTEAAGPGLGRRGAGPAPAPPIATRRAADGPHAITVVYDEQCELCRRCRRWLAARATHVPVRFIAAGSPEARRRWPDVEWLGVELVVVGDEGQLWVGPAAFLVCLWATVRYRPWAFRLASPAMAPLARGFVHRVSKERHRFGRTAACPDGTCGPTRAQRAS